MSFLTPNLQIWDNAAFDPTTTTTTATITPLQSITNLDLPSNENQPPVANLDAEIAAIESEIARLSKNLLALRLKRSQLQNTAATNPRAHRRGLSMGPTELRKTPNLKPFPSSNFKIQDPAPASRRGMSIGPAEILRQRKAIDEIRRGAATVGPKVSVAKAGGGLGIGIRPKNLFAEIEEDQTVAKKKPKGRVIASRYSLPTKKAAAGGEDDCEGGGGKRPKWDPPATDARIGERLPRIRIARGMEAESPRDSGRAKKVAELMAGKRSYFSDSMTSSCQRLSY